MDIKKLVSQMTLEEKAKMCSGKSFWITEDVERLGIPCVMLTDGPCGIRKQEGESDHLGLNSSIPAVSFPTGSCVASSFDRALLKELGETLAEECQAENIGIILGPAANIKRSPLCGRNFEYFSEDPYLTGELSVGYIKGVQSKNVGVSLKHFACNNQETRRLTSDSVIDERTFREIYLPGFEAAVKEAKPWTVMCSYNKINGVYASENHRLLTEILRDEWGFDGYVVSDWGATNDRIKGIDAGMDLEMPGDNANNTKSIIEAVNSGVLAEEKLNTSVERILDVSYRYIENRDKTAIFNHEKGHKLARKSAAQSMVLLKNDGILPLSKKSSTALIGKFADKPRFQGGGSSHVNSYKVTSARNASEGLPVTYSAGYDTDTVEPDNALIAEAVLAAKTADSAVLFVGIPDRLESEGFDRKDLRLPACQEKLISEVTRVQPNTIVIVHCGGAIEMPWINDVKAVLYAYLGGEAVGDATIDILYGDVNPSGKLAETFPVQLEDNSSYLYFIGEEDTTEYREGVFVGYRYYDKKKMNVLFPFGHGLSYTSFDYSDLVISKKDIDDSEELVVSVKVKNTGKVFGAEVVQLYIENPKVTVIRPVKELRGFEKVQLEAGCETTVTFTLDKRAFAYYNTEISDWYVEGGEYKILIGKSSRNIVLTDTVAVKPKKELKRPFTIFSTLGDVFANPIGAQIAGQFMAQLPLASVDSSTLGIDNIMDLARDMPLKTLLSFSGGAVSSEMLQGMITILNSGEE